MPGNRKEEVDAAAKEVDFSKNKYQIELDTTAGKITLDLNGDVAPGHCKNMIGLAKIAYYDGVLFHRIIKGFMIQGGCPLGTGTGSPGYTIKAEFNTTPHEAGVRASRPAIHCLRQDGGRSESRRRPQDRRNENR
jgi:peptidyl-prolyl cis-trans isomerase B (cyclophilin B)